MYFSVSFALQTYTCELFNVPQEKRVYNVHRFTITQSMAAGLQIISLKVVHELKIAANISKFGNGNFDFGCCALQTLHTADINL